MDRFKAEIILTLVLSLTVASASKLIDISSIYSLAFALPIFVLYGLTAYTSQEGFRKSSLASLPALSLVVMGGFVSVVAIAVGIGNVLVSIFAGGDRFREYYGSTRIPLLVLGLILGVFAFQMAVSNPQVSENIRNTTADVLGNQTEQLVIESNIISSQMNKQTQLVENTANLTMTYTEAHVLNETQSEFNLDEQITLREAFDSAENSLDREISNRTSNVSNEPPVDISARVGDVIHSRMSEEKLVVLIPTVFFLTLGLQPLVGILTAISARLFELIDDNLLESGY